MGTKLFLYCIILTNDKKKLNYTYILENGYNCISNEENLYNWKKRKKLHKVALKIF